MTPGVSSSNSAPGSKRDRESESPSARSTGSSSESETEIKNLKRTKAKRASSVSSSSSRSSSEPSDSSANSSSEEEIVWEEKKVVDENVELGPVRPAQAAAVEGAALDFGRNLLPGEGSAMAQYVQSNKRIPRRGEVGMTAEEIESFENLGYVMSGSRHQRMNAVRLRKESQIYSAEEKRLLAMYNYEEKASKEAKVLSSLRNLVKETTEKQGKKK